MNTIEIQTKVSVFDSPAELGEKERQLVKKAGEALKNAYAPYSGFQVGAAILLDNGEMVLGNNQENSSFPVGICAERVALANQYTNHPGRKIIAIAVSVENDKATSPASPCGMCRQAMYEAESKQGEKIKVILKGPADEVYVVDSVEALLPLPFSSNNL